MKNATKYRLAEAVNAAPMVVAGSVEAGRGDFAGGISSDALLGAHGELKIQHNGAQYTLRRTRQGKLILTK
jgi:hemin uptake protein HemP